MAKEAVDRFGRGNVVLLNHDISSKVEHADIKRFKFDVAAHLGIPITYANADNYEDMTPLEVSLEKNCFKSPQGHQLCTYYLKTLPFQNWLEENFGGSFDKPCEDVLVLYGFDAGEKTRIQRRASIMASMGYYTDYPLAYWPRHYESTRDFGIQPPSTYSIFKHANCIGCLKAGRQHWYCVYCLRPDLWEQAKAAEWTIGYTILKGVALEDLESQFRHMKEDLLICPDDCTNSGTFWARVNRALPDQQSFLPCDCSY